MVSEYPSQIEVKNDQQPPLFVLVIDDDEGFLESLRALILDEGMHCLGASNCDASRSLIEENEIDVILLDYQIMGNEDLAFLGEISEKYPHIPIILITGYPSMETAIESFQYQVYDYLTKPFDCARLIQRLCEAGEKKRLQDARREIGLREQYLDAIKRASQSLLPAHEVLPFEDFLACLGRGFKARRIHTLQNHWSLEGARLFSAVAEWTKAGIEPVTNAHYLHNMPYFKGLERWERELAAGRPLQDKRGNMPEGEAEFLKQLGIESILLIPLLVDVNFEGFLAFEPEDPEHVWSNMQIEFLTMAANDLSLAIRRYRAEQALRESKERFRAIADYSHDWESWVGPDGRLIWVNSAVKRLTGYSPEECLDMHDYPMPMVPPEDKDKMWRLFRNCLEEKNVGNDKCLSMVRKDGRGIHVSMSWHPIYNQFQRYLGQRLSIRDISERKRMEEEREELLDRLQKAQKMESLSMMASGIAHDFNNLLMVVIGNAELALMDIDKDHFLAKPIEEMGKAAQKAAELSQKMLVFSGHGKYHFKKWGAKELLYEIKPELDEVVGKEVELEYQFDEQMPNINADLVHIQQMMMSVIRNSREAITHMRGRIVVRLYGQKISEHDRKSIIGDDFEPGEYICIEVSDNGSGMDEKTLAKAFDPFFTTRFTGRGLGLPAVLGIAKAHHGGVEISSQPDIGTVCKIYLPQYASQETKKTVAPAAIANWKMSGTILFADDQEQLRTMSQRSLSRYGFNLILAENGAQALHLYRENKEHLCCIILDQTMPEVTGAEALEEIRKEDREVPIILCSGYSEKEIEKLLPRDQIQGFLQKPFSMAELTRTLYDILEDKK
ncbi:MAG: response regulator [Candidatus Sumerlaeia bacterium]